MKLYLKIWRQNDHQGQGNFADYTLEGVTEDMSFLEMLDLLNEQLTSEDKAPVEFDSDCREGICGSCGFMINGQAHGPVLGAAVCQVFMRHFREDDTIIIEPWRAKAFPIVKDLVVDRSSLDRIITAGGYVSTKTGPHPDGNTILVSKSQVEQSLDYASCIQCGACVAACPNASASLFTGAQIARFVQIPQGKIESSRRTVRMVEQMDNERFGHCTNIGECEAACPKKISIHSIVVMRREHWKAITFT